MTQPGDRQKQWSKWMMTMVKVDDCAPLATTVTTFEGKILCDSVMKQSYPENTAQSPPTRATVAEMVHWLRSTFLSALS